MNNNMKKMFDTEVFASDDEYEDNNVPNYDLFNKHVFDIFQQVETLEFAYTVVVSKWNVLGYHFPTITDYLVWRKKWFQDEYLEKTIDDINDDNLFDSNKKRRRNLNADNESFHHAKKKLKVDSENKSCEDEIMIVKVVPSLVIGKNHARIRCSLGKGHNIDNTNCPCPVPYCSSGSLASTFNAYPADLKQAILCTGIDLNKKKSKAKVPNWKLNDIDFVQSNFTREKKMFYNQRKRNFKHGLANHIALNIQIEKEDNKKSKVKCDHSKYKKFIPASWVKYVNDEINKKLLLGDNNLIIENNEEQSNSSKTITSLKLFHKNELFRIKVQLNILISLLKEQLTKHFNITKDIKLYYNNNELSDTKSLSSYEINYNENVQVVVITKKVDDEKDINVE